MIKKLQVILQDSEYRKIRRLARTRKMSLAEWVRQALDSARQKEALDDDSTKLEAIRAAARHEFSVCDVDCMLAEIESGYIAGRQP